MADNAVSSSGLDHSSSMLDFLKGTLKEVPRLYCLNIFAISAAVLSVLYILLCPSRGPGCSSTTVAMVLREDLSPTN